MGGRLMPVEVYPVVASVAAAVACSAYALKRKWVNDPQVTVSKGRRSGGTTVAYEHVEEAQPFWTGLAKGSISIFGDKSNPIAECKKTNIITEMVVSVPVTEADADSDADNEPEDTIEDIAIIESADTLVTASDAEAENDA